MPRFVRHPFLVSLYAIYEAVVTEIAALIGEQKSVELNLDDIRGRGFLDRAQKYYKHVLCEPCIPLTEGGASWKSVRLLADLRHVIAHTNGKMDRVTKGRRDVIETTPGITIEKEMGGFMIVEADLLSDIFDAVNGELRDLVRKYLDWDSAREGIETQEDPKG